jgi:hypothetical protein
MVANWRVVNWYFTDQIYIFSIGNKGNWTTAFWLNCVWRGLKSPSPGWICRAWMLVSKLLSLSRSLIQLGNLSFHLPLPIALLECSPIISKPFNHPHHSLPVKCKFFVNLSNCPNFFRHTIKSTDFLRMALIWMPRK